MNSYQFKIGALYRRAARIRLDELGLPYSEHSSLFDSVIIVKAYNAIQEERREQFAYEVEAMSEQINALKERRKREEDAAKLAKMNRRRRMTFRKPLDILPA